MTSLKIKITLTADIHSQSREARRRVSSRREFPGCARLLQQNSLSISVCGLHQRLPDELILFGSCKGRCPLNAQETVCKGAEVVLSSGTS
jgi:hypothetical protein